MERVAATSCSSSRRPWPSCWPPRGGGTCGSPAEHRAVSPSEIALIDAGGLSARGVAAGTGTWKRVLRNRDILLLDRELFLHNYVLHFFFNWLFVDLVDNRNFKILQGGYFAAAPWVTGTTAAIVGGLTCDRLSRCFGIRLGCRLPAILGMVLAAALIAAAATAVDPYVAVILLSLCLGCQQFTDATYSAATIDLRPTCLDWLRLRCGRKMSLVASKRCSFRSRRRRSDGRRLWQRARSRPRRGGPGGAGSVRTGPLGQATSDGLAPVGYRTRGRRAR